MKKSRFSEEQIVGILRQAEQGLPVKELCRTHGFSEATFYNWRTRYGGLEQSEVSRLRKRARTASSRNCWARRICTSRR